MYKVTLFVTKGIIFFSRSWRAFAVIVYAVRLVFSFFARSAASSGVSSTSVEPKGDLLLDRFRTQFGDTLQLIVN